MSEPETDDDIPGVDREAVHARVDADDRQCYNAFRLLVRVERRTIDLLGFECVAEVCGAGPALDRLHLQRERSRVKEEIGVQAELRAAVAVAIHEVLVEIEARIVHAIKATTSIRQAN